MALLLRVFVLRVLVLRVLVLRVLVLVARMTMSAILIQFKNARKNMDTMSTGRF